MQVDDAEALQAILVEIVKTHDAKLGRRDTFGQRYTLDFILEWRDKQAVIRSGWIIEFDSSVPKLTTFIPVNVSSEAKMIKLLDIVALTVDLPEYMLWRGQVGTVVELLANNTAYEVEFSDREGRTYESIGLRPDQVMLLYFEPIHGNDTQVAELA